MKCLDDCHNYELNTMYGKEADVKQRLKFIKKTADGVTIDGVTNEEVLRVLIHRIGKLDELQPCYENKEALEHIERAWSILNLRTLRREIRGVEGKLVP